MNEPLSSMDELAGEELLAALVAAYRPALTRLALSILSDPAEAEDAVQQAFISAARRLDSLRPASNYKAWLYAITVNACRGMLRKRAVRRALLQVLGREVTARGETPLESAYLLDERDRLLWQAVDGLDQKRRLVVLLRYQHGLTIREISQALSVKEPTVYTRLGTALTKLRLSLSGRLFDQE